MADRIIRIRIDARDATRGINQVEGQMQRLDDTTNRVNTSMTRLAAAVASALSVQKLASYADQWTDLESRFRNAVGEGENAADVLQRINEIANSSFSSLQNTSEAFLLNARTLRELNFTTQQQLDLTEALSLALVVSGAKQQRAESVTNAFSKAIAAGTLQGDNFNTVIQSGGEVVAALADGLGVTTIELQKMARDGLLTVDKVVPALTSRLEDLRQKANEMPATIADAFLILNNKALEYIGTLDKTVGASQEVSDSILFVANNLDALTKSLGVLAVIIVSKYVASLTLAAAAKVKLTLATTQATIAQIGYTAALNAGRVALSLLAGPLGLVAIAAGSFFLFAQRADEAKESARELASVNDFLAQSYDNLTASQVENTRFQLNEKIRALKAEQELIRQNAALSAGLSQDELAAAAAFTGATASVEQIGNAANASQAKVDALQQNIDALNGRLKELPEGGSRAKAAVAEVADQVGRLGDSLSGLRSVSSGLDSLFSGEFNLFGGAEDTSAQDEQTAARINARIEGLRLETQTIASELALQKGVRDGFFTQEAADLAAQTAHRILALNTERELILAEQALTNEQRLELEEAYQEQLLQINRQYSEGRIEVDRLERLTRIDLAQQFANASISLISAFGSRSFQAQKNAAIASGIVNIAGGVAKALNNPYPANLGFAAQVAAQGATLISTIKSTNISSGGGGIGGVGGPQALPTTPQAAPVVGSFEIAGLSDLQRQLDDLDNDEVLPVSFTRRLVASLKSVQRLRGEG